MKDRYARYALTHCFLLLVILLAGVALALPAPGGVTRSLSVRSFSPEGLAGPRDSIQISFSSEVVSSEDIGRELAADERPVTITPEVRGDGRWSDGSTFVFRPYLLTAATNYSVKIADNLSDFYGNRISGKLDFKFFTAPLEFRGARQTDFNVNNDYVDYEISFSLPVSPHVFIGSFSLKNSAKEAVTYAVRTSENSSVIPIRVRAEDGSPLSMQIAKGLVSDVGPLGLAQDITLQLERDLSLKVRNSYATSEYGALSIYLETTSRVDIDKAKPFIDITPPGNFSLESYGSTLRITGDFKPRGRVTARLRKGLPPHEGAPLGADWVRSFIFPDLTPTLNLSSSGRFISPAEDALLIPVTSVNIKKMDVEVHRVYDNNVSFVMLRGWPYYRDELSEQIFKKNYQIDAKPNESAKNALDLKKMLNGRKGIFEVVVSDNEDWPYDHMAINVTDMAGTVKITKNGLLAWVNSISEGSPVRDASVSVFSRSNQLLGEGRTNAKGVWELKRGNWERDTLSQPNLVIFHKGDDVSVLPLKSTINPMNDQDMSGAPYPKEYEAMCFTPRGVFRPGERAPIMVLARDGNQGLKEPFPVKLRILTPQGREWSNATLMLSPMGMASTSVQLSDAAPTGTWIMEVFIPGEESRLAYGAFLVEDFAPPRITVEVSSDVKKLSGGDSGTLFISSRYLFGSPADGLDYSVTASFIPREYSHPDWRGYEFSDRRRSFNQESMTLAQGALGMSGEAQLQFEAPVLSPQSILDVVLSVGVMQDDGRWVYKTLPLPYYPTKTLLGIKRPDGGLVSGAPIAFGFAAVDPSGAPASPRAAQIFVSRIERRIIVTRVDGDKRYEVQTELVPLESYQGKNVQFSEGKAEASITFPSDGIYLIAIQDNDAGTSAAIETYVYNENWGVSQSQASLPEKLDIIFDKKIYKPGEKARAKVSGGFDGTVLLTVETDEIIHYETAVSKGKTADFTFNVTKEMLPNAWVTAHLVRPTREEEPWTAHRAFGASALKIDCSPLSLDINITSPEKLRPRAKNNFSIELKDSNGKGAEGEIALMLVDDGVLNLTRFNTPDPYEYFTRKRALNMNVYDVYDDLLPILVTKPPLLNPGGGVALDQSNASLSPVRADRFRVLTLSKRIVTDKNGKAEFSFVLPEFSGRARLMAVAATRSAFGARESFFTVSRNVVLEQSLPRAAAPGDSFRSDVMLFNRTGASLDVNLEVNIDGPLSINSGDEKTEDPVKSMKMKIALPPSENVLAIPVELHAEGTAGVAKVIAVARYSGGATTVTTDLPIRPPFPRVSSSGSVIVKPGESQDISLPGGWMAGTRRANLSLSGLPEVNLSDAALFLLNYPYYCLEQTVSSGWVLLSQPELVNALDPNLATAAELSTALNARIRRIQALQMYDGSFSSWAGGSGNRWVSVYATHFLVTCEKKGIQIPGSTVDSAMSFLMQLISESPEQESDYIYGSELALRAYASYVISLAGNPPLAWMSYLRDNINSMPEYGRIILAAAFASGGERGVARSLLGNVIPSVNAFSPSESEKLNLDSDIRRQALHLMAWNAVDPTSVNAVNSASELLRSIRLAESPTTQEFGFALPALADFYSHNNRKGSAVLEAVRENSPAIAIISGDEISNSRLGEEITELTVKNTGSAEGYVSWVVDGVPFNTPPAEDSGLRVRVEYSNSAGESLLSPITIERGQRIVGKIRLEPLAGRADNIVVSLPFAGGLEVENPRLIDSASMEDSSGSRIGVRVELRDDRLLLFIDEINKLFEWKFSMRAVTPGNFILPPIAAEGMYSPGSRTTSQPSRVSITSR